MTHSTPHPMTDSAPGAGPPVLRFPVEASRAVDRAAIEDLGIPGMVLMEHAARALARRVLARAGGRPRVLVVCGAGNNGGDGYAAARLLAWAGARVRVVAQTDARPDTDAGRNAAIWTALHPDLDDPAPAPVEPPAALAAAAAEADVIVDAIFGTGLDRDVTGEPAGMIATIDALAADRSIPVIAADVPSGLDARSGRPLGVAVRATETVTFVGPKPGLLRPEAAPFVGELWVAPIGVPAELERRHGEPFEPARGAAACHRLTW